MSTVGKLSREEWRKQKDLDAARKAGTAPAEIGEDGEVINPHVPDYMSKAPWYLDTGKRSLKHQKKPETGEKTVGINDWYERGVKTGERATKYRKGACENCGASTHKTKDCIERPRKKGAKWTNKDIAADEHITDFGDKKFDFAAKRDRWNGYDPAEHKRVLEEYEAVEEERRRLREEEIDKQTSTDMTTAKKLAKQGKKSKGPKEDGDFSSSDEEDEDEDKYAEAASMAGTKVDTTNRMSIRNLRIREDRAKYLYNLNPDSAYYDPKTRSMREAPEAGVRPEDASYAGDNFNRAKGDTLAMHRLQLFAWQAEARGNDVHLQANPTVNEKQFREFQEKKEKLRASTKGSILDKYGGAEHFDSVPKELLTGQSESYVEYSRSGQVIRGQEKASVRSRFEEDVLDNNHTAVWGSWYDLTSGSWGYKCCHSTTPNSYCTGQAGIEASRASAALAAPKPAADEATSSEVVIGKGKAREIDSSSKYDKAASSSTKRRARSRSSSSSSSRSGSDSDFSATDSDDSRRDHSRKRRHSSSDHRRKRRSRSFSSSDEDDRRRSHKSSSRSGKKSEPVKGYTSTKKIGEGDVSSRLDKDKLKKALAEEDARQHRKVTSAAATKPDWLVEAEQINAGVGGKKQRARFGEAEIGEGTSEVSEEQMEAYKLKSKNDYEDPMAGYRDEEAV